MSTPSDAEIDARRFLLYKSDMTIKRLDKEGDESKLQKLNTVTKLRITGATVEAYNGEEWSAVDDELAQWIVQKEERIELAHLSDDVKSQYTLKALIVVE
jgi:hypothetical protein